MRVWERNVDIRKAKAGVPNWAIAERLGIHENTLLRKLRFEMMPEEKMQLLKLIDELKRERVAQ